MAGTLSVLDGSLLHCPTIIITASNVVVSDSSEISANGTSHMTEALNDKLWATARGASHGGLGGTANCLQEAVESKRLVHGDAMAPWHFGKAAGPVGRRGAGGGRLRLHCSGALRLNGTRHGDVSPSILLSKSS